MSSLSDLTTFNFQGGGNVQNVVEWRGGGIAGLVCNRHGGEGHGRARPR